MMEEKAWELWKEAGRTWHVLQAAKAAEHVAREAYQRASDALETARAAEYDAVEAVLAHIRRMPHE